MLAYILCREPHLQQHHALRLHWRGGLHHEGPGHEVLEEEEATDGERREVVTERQHCDKARSTLPPLS